MTIQDAVKIALSQTRGNWTFDVDHIAGLIYTMDVNQDYSRDQISRAIRNAKGVKRVGVGKYQMKGRRVL